MIQCKDCEFCVVDEKGRMQFKCNPFDNVKEPECLHKWMVLKLDMLLHGYQSMLSYYNKFAPMQEKMFKFMEREIDDAQDADQWKYSQDQDNEQQDDTDDQDPELC